MYLLIIFDVLFCYFDIYIIFEFMHLLLLTIKLLV